MTVNELEDAMVQGHIDAAVAYEPIVSRLQASGGHVLFTRREIPGEIVDVVVVRRGVARAHPWLVPMLRDAWFEAVALCRDDPTAHAAIAARRLGDSGVDVRQPSGLRVPDRQESHDLVTGGLRAPADRLVRAMREVSGVAIADDVVDALWPETP